MSIFSGKIPAKSEFSDELPEAGYQPARLIGLIDLGTHIEEYQGASKEARKIYLLWELTAEPIKGTEFNHVMGKMYTLSYHAKSALRQMLEQRRGKVFQEGEDINLHKVLGLDFLLTISHKEGKERSYATISAVGPPMKGQTVPPAKRSHLTYEIGTGQPIPNQAWLPFIFGRSVKEMIEDSQEMKGERQKVANGNGKQADPVAAHATDRMEPYEGFGPPDDTAPF